MNSFCAVEYGLLGKAGDRRCGRLAVGECVNCKVSVCSSCGKECCGKLWCGYCYDYHAIHSCLTILRNARSTTFLWPFALLPATTLVEDQNVLKSLGTNEQGQDIAEYGVMLALILVLVMGTLRLVGSNANNVFSSVASAVR